MATFTLAQGTAVIWGDSGGSGVTLTLTLDALADGSGRMGAVADLGATFAPLYLVQFRVESGTAPTAGNRADLYFAPSFDGTTFAGGVTGSDAAWPSDGNEDEWSVQLEYITSLIATNDGNTVQVAPPVLWVPKGRYVAPVVDNNLGQAFRDQATASNNLSRVILIPITHTVA